MQGYQVSPLIRNKYIYPAAIQFAGFYVYACSGMLQKQRHRVKNLRCFHQLCYTPVWNTPDENGQQGFLYK
jgi:hypothetical protein